MEGRTETELDAGHHYLLDWLEEPVPFVPSFLDDPYAGLHPQEWWNNDQCSPDLSKMVDPATASTSAAAVELEDLSNKRKQHNNEHEKEEGEVHQKKKKQAGRGGAGGSGSGGSKDVRWAEQLLNPCAAAIEAGNLSRAQHLLYVLRELASSGGEPNHRLAAFGMRALTSHLSSLGAAVPLFTSIGAPTISYAIADPKIFRSALIRFHEVSPWFALPNALANASIIQALDGVGGHSQQQQQRPLHIVDFGVSHGVQWPTLLEALTRRAVGPPPLVHLTVVGSTTAPLGPFSSSPVGYDSSVPLLRYAKSINLNLHIDHALNFHAAGDAAAVVVVCLQFRAGQVCGNDRTALLQTVRELGPDLVVLSEVEWSNGEQDVRGRLGGFPRRAEMVWKFLESTAAAFKGKESAERAVVEGEAARWLQELGEDAEGAGEWKGRAVAAGLREEWFGEEALDAGKALLRKFDSSWEMRSAGSWVGLWWKGQPVSFCSLWKPHGQGKGRD